MFVRKIINKIQSKFKYQSETEAALAEAPDEKGVKAALKNETASPEHQPKPGPKRKKKTPRPKPEDIPQNIPADDPIIWDVANFQVPRAEGKTRFHDLHLPNEIMHAIADTGFQYCTPIQAETLHSTISGKDATGRAQTGTGKTAAFLITILTHILREEAPAKRRFGTPRALILAPTRELVLQIVDDAEILAKYCPIITVGVLGGVDYAKQQRQVTQQKVDIVVATPGRLIDFQNQRYIHLDKVEILVIDEADRMLDMGFIPDVRRIVYSTPQKDKRQTLLFSATLTPEVTNLSSQWTKDPVVVEIEPEHVVTDMVKQLVYLVTAEQKFALLYNIIKKQDLERVIVFCNRRDETRWLTDRLKRYDINCAVLSGEVPQDKRLKRLEGFKSGRIRVLVATDVAGRGIHIEGISHVINYTLPYEPENYVHRIGRTGRAGTKGISVSFADETDSFYISDIEEFIGDKLHCTQPEVDWLELPPAPKRAARPPRRPRPGQKKRPAQQRYNKSSGNSASRSRKPKPS